MFEEQPDYKLLLERTRVSEDPEREIGLDLSSSRKLRVAETTTYPGRATLALMLDSVRKRLHLDSSRLALHKHVAPFQTAVVIEGEETEELHLMRDLILLLAEEKGIAVSREVISFESADALGIPYAVVVGDQSLELGVVRIRDRESCWFEEVHLAHVAKRLAHIYQGRIVPDTWEEMQAEEGDKYSLVVEKTKKAKKKKEST